MCLCEKDSVDMVMGRLAHCGVGNIIGSVNVVSLDTSMFSKASADLLKEEMPCSGSAENPAGHNTSQITHEEEEEEEDRRKMFMDTASKLRVEQVVEQIKV